MKILAAAAFAALLAASAAADVPAPAATAPEAPLYKVIEENVSIPFAGRSVRDFQVGEDDSLILRSHGRWYRAVLWRPCRNDLKWEHRIALVSRPTDTLDRFSKVIVDGHRCPIESIDQIEKPLSKAERAKAAAAAKGA